MQQSVYESKVFIFLFIIVFPLTLIAMILDVFFFDPGFIFALFGYVLFPGGLICYLVTKKINFITLTLGIVLNIILIVLMGIFEIFIFGNYSILFSRILLIICSVLIYSVVITRETISSFNIKEELDQFKTYLISNKKNVIIGIVFLLCISVPLIQSFLMIGSIDDIKRKDRIYYEGLNPPVYQIGSNSSFNIQFYFDYGEKPEYIINILLNTTLMYSNEFYCERYDSTLISIYLAAPSTIGNYLGKIHVSTAGGEADWIKIEDLFLEFYVIVIY